MSTTRTKTTEPLLTRDEFREAVFARDGRCVCCGSPYADAHHILERRLFPDGGYYLSNGAAVCGPCHVACESTDISVETLRERCGIAKPVLPTHLYDDQRYDKWGNPILPSGARLRGELFFDESVQKALGGWLNLFTHWVKYPRTHHLPWSDGINDDDRVIDSVDHFIGKEVVVTAKMDGENTTMYPDHIHARSLDGNGHPSRDWVKQFWGKIRSEIPEGWRVCGENLYAVHSIRYEALPTYFLGFSAWDAMNACLGWDDTVEWFGLLGITPVPVLYRGTFDEAAIRKLWTGPEMEGYVVRLAGTFPYGHFKRSVAKFVRKDHNRTTRHWMHGQAVERNGLAV